MYPSRFRELLAREADLPSDFFHYSDEGCPKPGLPPIRVIGGRRWLGVLVTGADARANHLFDAAIAPSIKIVSQEFGGRVVPIRVENPAMDVTDKRYPQNWWVREMAIKRRSEKARDSDLVPLIEKRLRRSILTQAKAIGVDLDPDFPLMVTEAIRPRGLRLVTTAGQTNEFVTLVDVNFSTTLDFEGFWFAGNLTARGYGRIGRELADLSVNFRAEQHHERKEVR
jgi:hypothetical protein